MQKIAFYRKYRPENFDDVVAQDHIVKILKNAIKENKVSHAYLFSGPRGTGKTSIARILAKALNCQQRQDYNPCGKCPICTGIDEGRIIDLMEIDAASNRGIDEIRDLREKVKFSPTDSNYKVFIIDEVHMLTKEAFNALLKTLEEPPDHAIFILATTEINKVPITVVSRCQRHDFRRIKVHEIVNKITDIAKKEKIKITDDALKLIADYSEGGLRDALSILDQIASTGLNEITEKDVEEIIGLTPAKIVIEYAENILSNNATKSLRTVQGISDSGMDLNIFVKMLSELYRKVLIAKVSGTDAIEGTSEYITNIKEIAEANEIGRLLELGDKLIWIKNNLKSGIDPKILLTILSASVHQEKIENKETPNKGKPTGNPKNQSSIAPNGQWQHFLMEMKMQNNTIHALLRVASPKIDNGTIILTFPYKFHMEQIEQKKNKEMVEKVLTKVYGSQICISCELEGNGSNKNKKIEDVKKAADILGGEVID